MNLFQIPARLIFASLLTLPASLAAAESSPLFSGIPCVRTVPSDLSDIAWNVWFGIQSDPSVISNSPVPADQILTFCNEYRGTAIDGPDIYSRARDLIAVAEHEVEIVSFTWEAESQAARLLGDGLITAQEDHTPEDPLLVRLMIDDPQVDLSPFRRSINDLWDSVKEWMSRGLDPDRVTIQLGTVPRGTAGDANLHDKYVIVDGETLLITGANVQKHNDVYGSGKDTGWHDTGYVAGGPVAHASLSAFDKLWTEDAEHWSCRERGFDFDCQVRSRYPQPSRSWLPPFGSTAPGSVPVLAVGRTKGRGIPPSGDVDNPQDVAWKGMLQGARSHIHVESPNLNDDAFRDGIVAAVQRGVTVRLIAAMGFNDFTIDLPGLGGDNQEVIASLRDRLGATNPLFQVRWYSRDGLRPVENNESGANHTKYMTIDDELTMVGSGNQDTISWNIAHEYNILIDDPEVTRDIESRVFLPDWERSIASYVELYEGNNATQDMVCPQSVVLNGDITFPEGILGAFVDTYKCNNDEAQSMLMHEVPAGKVLRFYDSPDKHYQNDDWTEIIAKRDISRRVIPTFESSWEDEEVRVIHHHDDGLDGKISAGDVSETPFGAIIDFHEGNSGTKNLVCSNRVQGNFTIDFKRNRFCDNDAARSLTLYDFPADKAIILYDSPRGRTDDDWTVIVPNRDIRRLTVDTFEHSFETSDIRVCHFHDNGLDGKVSYARILDADAVEAFCPSTLDPPVSGDGPYTLEPEPDHRYPDSGGELTDGIIHTGKSWVNAVGWIDVDPVVTLDLGTVELIDTVEMFFGNSEGTGKFGVARPASVVVSVSTDGTSWADAGELLFSEHSAIGTKEQVDVGEASLAVPARWIRFSVTAGGPWVMATEIRALAGTCPNAGQPCDGDDGDLCEEGTIQEDCSCSDTTDTNLDTCNGIDDDCDGEVDEGACPIGGPYVLDPEPDPRYPDSSGNELTDGIIATGESWINAAGWIDVDPTITLDLGQTEQVDEARIYVGNSFGNGSFGVYRPEDILVSISTDGMNFSPVGSMSITELLDVGTKEQVDRGIITIGLPARWIRYEITRGGPWVMVTEIEAEVSSCPSAGQPCDGPDGDLCEEGTVQADCSCSDTTSTNDESCNGLDDDCDGTVDEGACPIAGPYSLDPEPDPRYPDSSGTELTDGTIATGESWINAVGWIDVDPTITLDLGETLAVGETRIYVGNSFGNGSFGVYRPNDILVSISTDGVSFSPVGSMSITEFLDVGTKEQVDRGIITIGLPARWIRYEITRGGPWVMVTEIEAK